MTIEEWFRKIDTSDSRNEKKRGVEEEVKKEEKTEKALYKVFDDDENAEW